MSQVEKRAAALPHSYLYLTPRPMEGGSVGSSAELAKAQDTSIAYQIRIVTLGRFQVFIAPPGDSDARQVATFANRQTISLLKCLLAAPGCRLPREQAREQLWPEHDAVQAGEALSHALSRLRRALDPARTAHEEQRIIHSDRETIWIHRPDYKLGTATYWIDFLEFQSVGTEALRHFTAESPITTESVGWKLAERALSLYRGMFLPSDNAALWTHRTRTQLSNLWASLLRSMGEYALQTEHFEISIDLYQQILDAHPDEEYATGRLMIAKALAGRRGDAMRTYETLCAALDNAHGIQPTHELVQLADAIRSATSIEELRMLV